MAYSNFFLALSLSLLVSAAFGLQLSREQQCRIERISAAQPTHRIQSEGGYTELWDEKQNQFQCAGVVAVKSTLSPNGLSLPNYHPNPGFLYVERGQGFVGISIAGCAETYHAHKPQYSREATEAWEEKQRGTVRDLHQKVHRIRAGDVVAIPPGVVHWFYNDGNEELVSVSINDLNHQSNQLDQKFRAFFLAGGVPRKQQQGEQTFVNVFDSLDARLMAEAYNIPEDIIRKMQKGRAEERGLSVIVREPMTFMRAEEEQERQRDESSDNGLEETLCSMKIRTNIDNRRDADIYSRQAGKLNVVDRNKLPILKYIDMSAEKGSLLPNALLSPDWAMLGHTIVYVTKGDAEIQVVDHSGQAQMKERVKQGDMFVVPQYYVSTAQAGNQGFEWVAFKTSGWPMRSPVAGYTSVIRAMPLQVLTNAYQMSPNEAHALKMNRGSQSLLLSPSAFGKRV
ncbi:hypothetical protein ACS0TY_007331 [Phlomoides rotata]